MLYSHLQRHFLVAQEVLVRRVRKHRIGYAAVEASEPLLRVLQRRRRCRRLALSVQSPFTLVERLEHAFSGRLVESRERRLHVALRLVQKGGDALTPATGQQALHKLDLHSGVLY